MNMCGWRIALAWVVVLSKSALCLRPEEIELHRSAQEEPLRQRGERDVLEEDDGQKDTESEEGNVFPKRSLEKATVIAGIPAGNHHAFYRDALERKGIDVGSWREFEASREVQKEWIALMSSDEDLKVLCNNLGAACTRVGSGLAVPFIVIYGTEQTVKNLLNEAGVTALSIGENDVIRVILEEKPESQSALESRSARQALDRPWGLERVGAYGGANLGSGATIYVLDTGVRVAHEAFSSRGIRGVDSTVDPPKECSNDLNDRACASDRYGHGTHCAGIAAGEGVGVAPGATVVAVKCLGDSGGGLLAWVLAGIDWAITKAETTRPAVVSMSLSTVSNEALMTYVDRGVTAGVVFVVSAGNSNYNSCYFSPANAPGALTVGAMTSTDSRASFSNQGKCTDIFAPGRIIVSSTRNEVFSYQTYSGTSQAAPHVAGAAAVLLQVNPEATPEQVRDQLILYSETGAVKDLSSDTSNLLLNLRKLPYIN